MGGQIPSIGDAVSRLCCFRNLPRRGLAAQYVGRRSRWNERTIEITLRDDTAWLDGTVSVDGSGGDDQGPYGPNFFVFCIPIGHSNGGMVPMAGAMNGKFTFRNLAPGQYLVLASRTFNPQFEYRNEEVLRQYESKGAMLTLTPGQKAEITVSKVMEDDE